MANVRIQADGCPPPVAFAGEEIRRAAAPATDIEVVFDRLPPGGSAPQAYRIRTQPGCVIVSSADPVGLMYGGLEVADALRDGISVADADRTPFVARRGIKFNLPLDLRTPSYSDTGDAAQRNIPVLWERDFWREFLDEMARGRYNVLTLWNLHPFPSMVRVPEYPQVALDDVQRTLVPFDTTFSLCGIDMIRPPMLERAEVVKTLTIDEKIAFWRAVMQHAADRGIEVYIFTWNLFTWGAEGKHGITCDQTNPVTLDYFRCSVRELILTYPLLAGIGITAGENLDARSDGFDKEAWLWKAYGEGVRDALRREPDRRIRLIHRVHQTQFADILDNWRDYPGEFDFSFKYAIAHMYASPRPPFAGPALRKLPAASRIWMTVRNDDHYCFRWGDPAYARDFIRHLPGPDQLAGFYMGPDGYVWGRDFLSRRPDPDRPLEIQRQWYTFRIWGLLSFDPSLPDERFRAMLQARFPAVDGGTVFAACAAASRIVPAVNRFYWNEIDLKMYPEACLSHPRFKGFHRVDHVLDGRPMPGSGLMSIRDFCAGTGTGTPPPDAIAALQRDAQAALAYAKAIEPGGCDELARARNDWLALGHLGHYYAAKFTGALELGRFDRTGDKARQTASVAALKEALDHWQAYAAVVDGQYQPQFFTRVGPVDWQALRTEVARDIRIADEWRRDAGEG
ncbi:MAG: carbohydrate-binding family 6 protein [Lentisphaeria bacterium]|nr:carbohydrate-binding family 6 protein [Lentisphaeria bacterium]